MNLGFGIELGTQGHVNKNYCQEPHVRAGVVFFQPRGDLKRKPVFKDFCVANDRLLVALKSSLTGVCQGEPLADYDAL